MAIAKDEWLERCAKRYVSAGAFETVADAKDAAKACWDADQDSHDFDEEPELAADADLECWDNDE